jgi:hypothetical protein
MTDDELQQRLRDALQNANRTIPWRVRFRRYIADAALLVWCVGCLGLRAVIEGCEVEE